MLQTEYGTGNVRAPVPLVVEEVVAFNTQHSAAVSLQKLSRLHYSRAAVRMRDQIRGGVSGGVVPSGQS